MTREEARLTLQENFGYLSEEHPRIVEAMKVAMNVLSHPSLPSNLDEAARKYGHEEPILPEGYNDGDIPLYERWTADAFKSGAEWKAAQFQKIEGELVDWYSTSDGKDYCCGVKTIDAFEVPEGFYIRKK